MSDAFAQALEKTLQGRTKVGIGTLGEKTVHAVLKHYFEPDCQSHEVKIGSYYADLLSADGVFEIQTAGFDRLRKKLTELLAVTRVTVVYPISQTKYLCQLDPDTGRSLYRRKSPKKGSIYTVFSELYKIKAQLKKPNFSLCLVLLDVEEYRMRRGGRNQKLDRIPTALREEIYLFTPQDYRIFLPPDLPTTFTAAQYARACHISTPLGGSAVNVLSYLGILVPIGKAGRCKLYTVA